MRVVSASPRRSPARKPHGAAASKTHEPWRQPFFRLVQESYARIDAADREARRAMYRATARMLHALCGEGWAQRAYFQRETSLARRVIREGAIEVPDLEAAVRDSLFANCWSLIWMETLLALDREEFLAVCRPSGAARLTADRGKGPGLVLAHSHNLFAQLFWRWMEHAGIDPGITLWGWTWDRPRRELTDPKIRALEGARELYAAQKALRTGGLVHALADGGRGGRDDHSVAFFGRRRPFQRTFAELAIGAGAPILPVDVLLDADGGVRIEIGAPLESDPRAPDAAAQAQHLTACYVAHLAATWRREFGNVTWRQLWRQVKYPPA
jgi:hypothetical protein